MDNETQILIEKLIEAIDSPDWWIIVITLINAIIMLWLGWRQYKLQKQQTYLQKQQVHQQEYELYKQMYIQIDKIETFAKIFLHKVAVILSDLVDDAKKVDEMDGIIKELNLLNDNFMESTYDIELKECGNAIDVGYYYNVLQEIKQTTMFLKYLVVKDKMRIHSEKTDLTTNSSILVNIIIDCCKDENYKMQLKTSIQKSIDVINNTKKSQIISTIKERIKPN